MRSACNVAVSEAMSAVIKSTPEHIHHMLLSSSVASCFATPVRLAMKATSGNPKALTWMVETLPLPTDLQIVQVSPYALRIH